MLKSKSLLDYVNLCFPNEYENNDRIILKHFQYLKKTVYFVASMEILKTLKYHKYLK